MSEEQVREIVRVEVLRIMTSLPLAGRKQNIPAQPEKVCAWHTTEEVASGKCSTSKGGPC